MKIKKTLGTKFRQVFRNSWDRRKLRQRDVSIITNHCMGGIMSHDLGLEFRSPTVNLKILPDDFIKFAENPREYLAMEIVPVEEPSVTYPVGSLGDIKLWFVHYHTFEEAVAAWNRRKERINWSKLRFMMTIRDGCAPETIERFDRLPEKKVLFDDKPHPECSCAVYTKCLVGKGGTASGVYISDIVNIWGKRAYQQNFDYIRFLNGD